MLLGTATAVARRPRSKPLTCSTVLSSFTATVQSKRLASTSTANASDGRSIAIIGAGLAGLTHALTLARGLRAKGQSTSKKHQIVVYESSDRVGGWVHSKRIQMPTLSQTEAQSRSSNISQNDNTVSPSAAAAAASSSSAIANEDATAVIELGPRSIRAANSAPGWSMMELIATLNLGDQLLTVSKEHPSAKNRLIYHDKKLHLMPYDGNSIWAMSKDEDHVMIKADPLQPMWSLFKKLRRQSRQAKHDKPINPPKWYDESVEDFLIRVIGDDKNPKSQELIRKFIDLTASAFFHGIYAADLSKLSVRMVAPTLYTFDRMMYFDRQSWLPAPFNMRFCPLPEMASRPGQDWAKFQWRKELRNVQEIQRIKKRLGSEIATLFKETSTMSFRNGMQALTDAIHKECVDLGVTFHLNTKVTSLEVDQDGTMGSVQTARGNDAFDRIVCALPSQKLQNLFNNHKTNDMKLPNVASNENATVAVVNVAFSPNLDVRLPQAFGFLVPRASVKEGDNEHGLLGIVFDSVAVPGQDNCTKLTMMFGGPFWKPGFRMYDVLMQKSDGKQKALDEALQLLPLALNEGKLLPKDINFPIPPGVVSQINIQRHCIPTYAPGHLERMYELHQHLSRQHTRPLSVIGASYTGVSVNDCVMYARRSAERIIAAERSSTSTNANVTGLEDLVE